ncbi:MAG: DUF3842 family protein [Victivallales bacterium]|nr:DUF3842 family protein [Victivallales bacterium]
MNILVIDAQGGGLGKQVITALKKNFPDMDITAVGTNTMATGVMLKAGASHAATGENAVVVGCRKADIIIGPLAIVIADSMFGEITPAMALAVAQSNAKRILIPFNHCDNIVVGIGDYNMTALIQEAIDEVTKTLPPNPS